MAHWGATVSSGRSCPQSAPAPPPVSRRRTGCRRSPRASMRRQRPQRPALSAFRGASSLHGRDHEFGAFLGAGRPARGDGLGLGVEADRIRPVLVEIAEAGALPAAEGVIGERYRNGEVDAYHADLHAVDEIARGVAIAGEDGNAVAVVMLGGKPHRFLVILD